MWTLEQAERMKDAPLSRIRFYVDYAARLQQQGKDIIRLEIGEPDFDTPEYIRSAAKKALDDNQVHYAHVQGLYSLRQAISEHVEKRHGVRYAPEEILVTNGVAQGIFLSLTAFLNPGDEVLVPDPGYICYGTVPNIAGARAVPYPLLEENKFQIDFADLEKLITDKTKAIVIISPSNPCGSILSEKTQEKLAGFVIRHNLLLIADEIYEDMVYDSKDKTRTIAHIPELRDRTIVLAGFSKYYAMTGWRIGYLLCGRALMDPILRLSFYMIACGNTFVQHAAEAALRGDDTACRGMVEEYKRRRDIFVGQLNTLPACRCLKPEGAFYVFLNIKDTGLKSEEFAVHMMENAGVSMVPGTIFGQRGEGYVRLSYASPAEQLVKAADRMRIALNELMKRKDQEQ